ncbi:ATP-binding protein [Propionicimonas sp.]|uniref:ATP-binding protein n=1 Tax=Propionicimonas sp. TaxID=1955623 RepID=UPI0017EEA823|nr:ATP-binding protein [Propionicimonas sp.]MBA3019632.1 ATP-binding protein [Propionicimonas sp.]MBU4208023.1 ATP-binding protein [Actinomycetota bacterium]MCG2805751.1 ATP-binding protein [Propionicimonas sp.]
MLNPAHTLVGNLRFTQSGTVWADYLVTGVSYGMRPEKEKYGVRLLHQALFRALGGESVLLGLTSQLDPNQLVARMLEGVDPDQCPAWVAECEQTLASLEKLQPGRRIYWLSIPLASESPLAGAAAVGRTALGEVKRLIGLPRDSPPQELVDRLSRQAARAVRSVPGPFQLEPATPAQMVWLHQHMLDRGLFQDWDLPTADHDQVTAAISRAKAGSAMSAPFFDEGGQTDQPKKELLKGNPFRRRYLKVVDSASPTGAGSYQSLLVVNNVPDGGFAFPGGELMGRIDECGLSVDWAMRLHQRSSAEVLVKNNQALAALNEQMMQRDNEVSHAVSALDRYADLLAEYASTLESDKLEVEVQATMIFCVSGPDAEAANSQASALADWVAQWGYRLHAPLGHQETLWWAMVPGAPTSLFVREYAQITTSASLSALCPLATVELGDAKGSALALNIGHGPMLAEDLPCGPTSLVFHDPDGATDRSESGSIAVSGDLGSGKSYTLKKIADDVVDRGGRVVVPDRTEMGEWALWAKSVSSSKVVDVMHPTLSLDPIRLWGLEEGSRLARAFLGPLLNLSPTSEQGVLMADVLDVTYLRQHGLDSMGALVAHLMSGCDLAGATDLARKINVFARQKLCALMFDPDLPAVSLSDRVIVILTHPLELPTPEELTNEHLFLQLGVEKIFGRALYSYIAVLAAKLCFEDRDTLAAFIVDEAHNVTSSPEGALAIEKFVREGRKARAITVLGSQDAIKDFPSDVLRGLIPVRILMRHTDINLAARGLGWLGLDPDDAALIDLVTKELSPKIGNEVPVHRRGEGLMRDATGRFGRIKVLAPANAERNQAARTGGRFDVVGSR